MIPKLAVLFAAGALLALPGCSGERAEESDSARRPEARDDYRVFAARCSKCHSLARPLNSGIDDDDHWKRYVARMRRQPGSGMSEADTVAILRFLHLYSLEERRRKSGEAMDLQSVPADASPAVAPVVPIAEASVGPSEPH